MNLGTLALEQSGSESSEPVHDYRRDTGKFQEIGCFSLKEGTLRFEERSLMLRNRMLEHLQKAELQVSMSCGRMRHRLERMKE